jgi:hypothetical protein
MVGANTFRNPALTAKLVTTLDHMSDGRAILGIGGAWFEREHKAYGIEFGSGFGERLDWLDEAVDLMAQMLRDGQGTARGRFYHATNVRNDPPPVQKRTADPHRRRRREEDAPHRREIRRRLEHRRRRRLRPAQGRGPPALVRRGRP